MRALREEAASHPNVATQRRLHRPTRATPTPELPSKQAGEPFQRCRIIPIDSEQVDREDALKLQARWTTNAARESSICNTDGGELGGSEAHKDVAASPCATGIGDGAASKELVDPTQRAPA